MELGLFDLYNKHFVKIDRQTEVSYTLQKSTKPLTHGLQNSVSKTAFQQSLINPSGPYRIEPLSDDWAARQFLNTYETKKPISAG